MRSALIHTLYSLLLFAYAVPAVVFGQKGFDNPLSSDVNSIPAFIQTLLETAVYILFPIAVVFIVYSGLLFVLAQGNSEKLSKAKSNFLWVIVGMAVLLGAWLIAKLIENTIDPLIG